MPPSLPTDPESLDQPYLEEFTATVTEIRELCRVQGRPLFQIALDHSSFIPTSGPLPESLDDCIGTFTATSRQGILLVAPISAVHMDAAGELWHTTQKPLQSGTVVVCRMSMPRVKSAEK